jgi:hypothetical protein
MYTPSLTHITRLLHVLKPNPLLLQYYAYYQHKIETITATTIMMMLCINNHLLVLLLTVQYLKITRLDGMLAAIISKHYLPIFNSLDVDSHFNGSTTTLQKRYLQDLVPVVTGVEPKMSSQTTKQMYEPLMAHDVTGLASIRNSLKLDGRHISIGIIDSGVDFTHPALGGCINE